MRRIFFLAWILFSIHAQARQDVSNSTSLYLQTDKHIYTPSERVWFTGYMLRLDTTINYHTLYVALIDPIRHKAIMTEKFILSAGLSYGMLDLPDSLQSGDYTLVAFTNNYLIDRGEQEFYQWISVRAPGHSPLLPRPDKRKKQVREQIIPELKAQVIIQPDSLSYQRRSKTSWTVQVTDTEGKPVLAMFSISCVLSKRLREPSNWDIRRFYYIDQHVFANVQEFNTGPHDIQAVEGYVKRGKKRISQSIPMLLMTSNNAVPFKTDKEGVFKLRSDQAIALWKSDAYISIAKGFNSTNFNIALWDYPQWVVNKLAEVDYPYYGEAVQDSSLFSPIELQHIDLFLHRSDTLAPTPTAPAMASQGQDFLKKIKPAYMPVAFPQVDYIQDSTAPLNINTTLYWQYRVVTDKQGKAEFSFFTGDLPGIYSCMIQGMTGSEFFNKTVQFTVN